MCPCPTSGLSVSMIPSELYRQIVDVLPILCVDIVIEDGGRYLLVKRTNEPLKGQWWVPGGRVLKGETIAEAAARKAREELGIEAEITGILGYYEDQFTETEFGLESGTHTVSIVVSARLTSMEIRLDAQGSDWTFAAALPERFRIRSFLSGDVR